MMAELGCYQGINLIFLDHKNVYTMKQLHDNLNSNEVVEALLANEVDFYDFNGFLSKYYATPTSGSVYRTHIFSMDLSKPAIMQLRDNVTSDVRVQNLRVGDWSDSERKVMIKKELQELVTMFPPGLRNIKQVELATKWRRLILEEFQDNI